MIVRNDPTDPMCMTTEERLGELASNLAAGVLRLHRRAAGSVSPDSQIPSGSAGNCCGVPTQASHDVETS